MNIAYQLLDDAQNERVVLSLNDMDSGFFDKLMTEGSLVYESLGSNYKVTINRSGTNSVTSNMGETTIYISEDGFAPMEVAIEGYVTADRNIYQDRVNNVMQMINAAA